jgi:phage shock protein PspC (stress-responsive transcriptional regulator)
MTDDSRPRLTRSDDRKLGGVAAGLAEYVDVDPTLMRVLFVLAFFLGFGTILLAYIVFWFVMPEQDDADPSRPAVSLSVGTTDPGLLLGGALVVIGALLLLNELAIDRWFGFGFLTVAWPVLLIAGGLALVLRARDRVAR